MPGELHYQLRWIVSRVIAVTAACLVAGCATLNVRNAVPNQALADIASLPDLPGVRFWGDESPRDILAEVKQRLPNMPRLAGDRTAATGQPIVEVLALSGGAGDGAFGAGLLAGWTQRGDRPEFEVVTGVSAGAIIAPFAYLGPQYDWRLKEIWTKYETNELVIASIVPGLLGGAALTDTTPLANLIAKYVNRRMLDEIAQQYRRGRMLLVGTTNLDAQRPVVWNMGEIAASGHPNALQLFRDVIMASAAIPGAFPPVEIPVVVNGKAYSEMHVDGGTTREVFVAPVNLPFKAYDQLYQRRPLRRFYIIKNGKLGAEYEAVKKSTIPIAARAIATLIKSQHRGDLYRIYRMVKDDSADFNLAAVPETFNIQAKQVFDTTYQAALYEEGVRFGRAGNLWMKEPPLARPAQ